MVCPTRAIAIALFCTTVLIGPLTATEPEPTPVSLRIRVQTDEGVFLVYDAMVPTERPRDQAGYLAYWRDLEAEAIYFYDGLLQSPNDVGHAMLALERDLLIDLGGITEFSQTLAWSLDEAIFAVPARDTGRGDTRKTSRPQARSGELDLSAPAWHSLTYSGALAAMGFDVGGSVATDPPPVGDEIPCDQPPASATKPSQRRNISDRSSGITRAVALPSPTATTPRQLITQAVELIPCIPGDGGGGGPPPPPPPPTPCPDDFDCDGIPNGSDPDVDGDGIPNGSDPDVDGDGIPNGSDPDVDGDGTPNGSDPDVDGDGIPNGNDGDIDGDGTRNSSDGDIDGDGIPNGSDNDDDGDGIPDVNDPEPGGCDADCPGACCKTTTGGCSIKKGIACTAADERYQGDETKCSPNPCCPFGTNAVFPPQNVSTHETNPSHTLGTCEWGWTDTEVFALPDVAISATCNGTQWCAVLTGLNGPYSLQARLIPNHIEVTGPAGNTTQPNHCSQVTELKALGLCSGAWYKLAAVVAHENVHASRLIPSLQNVAPQIEQSIEALCVPHIPEKSQSDAISEIRISPGFLAATQNARTIWDAQYVSLIAGDHSGPTDAAEHVVVDPMISSICTHSKNQCWPICLACPPRPKAACCNPTSGTCAVETRCDCEAHGGVYRSNQTTCGPPNPCMGACCGPAPNPNCALTPASACLGPVDHYNGDGTVCSPNACDGPG